MKKTNFGVLSALLAAILYALSTPFSKILLKGVSATMLAMLFFHEKVGLRLWFGILLITFSCILLSVEDYSSLSFSPGSLLVLLAALCWGLENNCTRKLSSKNPLQIVFLKGIFSGSGSMIIALFMGEWFPSFPYLILALLLGSISYGFSIYAYIYAQRFLGVAKTGAFYSVAPFVAVVLSLLLFLLFVLRAHTLQKTFRAMWCRCLTDGSPQAD